MSLSVGSLFAGIGGFDLAAERVGMAVAWQSEIDPKASAVLDYHWPEVPNLGDVNDVTDAPGVDVLTGGFPCQDYSVAGTRGGLAGDRGALWWEYLRLITDLRPTWVVGENVPGLLSSRDGADFETIVGSLTECGYGVAWAVLDAQYFGVAQRRRRVFIVGHSGGEPRPEVLALSEGLFGHPAPSRSERKGVAGAVAGRPDLSSRVSGTLGALTGGSRTTDLDQMGAYVAFAQNQRDEVRDLDDKAGALAAEPGVKQQTYVLQGSMLGRNPEAGPNGKGYHDAAEYPGYTLDIASGTQGIASLSCVRRLTPRECELLQGFPVNWTAVSGNSDTQRMSQLGNAVAVPVVEWILRNIGVSG